MPIQSQFPATFFKNSIPPEFTTPATINDTTPQVDQVVTVTPGTVTGSEPITYTYQWRRNGADIAAATDSSYVVTGPDIGSTLSVTITATNTVGSDTQTSAETSIVVEHFADDFARADGVLGNDWVGLNWTIANGVTVNTPQLGAEKFTNASFDTWSGDNPTGYSLSAAETAGSIEITQRSSTQLYADSPAGTGAANFFVNIAGTIPGISQSPAAILGHWSQYDAEISARISGSLQVSQPHGYNIQLSTIGTNTATGRTGTPFLSVRAGANPTNLTLAQHSLKLFSVLTLFAYHVQHTAVGYAEAKITRKANTQSGLTHFADSNNFVHCYNNGSGNIILEKRVGGTYTQITSVAAAYVAGAVTRLTRNSSGQYSVSYNGVQVISAQSVVDTVFNTAIAWGLFSTHVENTFNDYVFHSDFYAPGTAPPLELPEYGGLTWYVSNAGGGNGEFPGYPVTIAYANTNAPAGSTLHMVSDCTIPHTGSNFTISTNIIGIQPYGTTGRRKLTLGSSPGYASAGQKNVILPATCKIRRIHIEGAPTRRIASSRSDYPDIWAIYIAGTESGGHPMEDCIFSDLNTIYSYADNPGGSPYENCYFWNFGLYFTAENQGDGEYTYTQNSNSNPLKTFNNVMYGQCYGPAFQLYTVSSETDHYLLEDIINLHGYIAVNSPITFTDLTVQNNFSWGELRADSIVDCTNFTFDNNFVYGSFKTDRVDNLTVTNNTVWRNHPLTYILNDISTNVTWDNNTYYNPLNLLYSYQPQGGLSFANWKSSTGYDANSTEVLANPPSAIIKVVPCSGIILKGLIGIANAQQLSSVVVDISSLGLTNGVTYYSKNGFDPENDQVSFVYMSGAGIDNGNGTITLSFTGRTVETPSGASAPLVDPNSSDFNFIGGWAIETVAT